MTDTGTGIKPGFMLLIAVVIITIVGLIYLFSNVSNDGEKQVRDDLRSKTLLTKGAIIKTNFGDIEVEFFVDKAPATVANFVALAEKGFYDDTLFHRVIKDFMIQGGDPLSRQDDWSLHGTGGPGYSFKDEINDEKIIRGALAMANSGPNTNGSQFFIVIKDEASWLDGLHTVFGRVVNGIEVIDKIEAVETNENDHPIRDVVVKKIVLK